MTSDHLTVLERITVLETRMVQLDDINKKLDDLLDLKSKGLGAIWLITLLVGSGLVSFLHSLISPFTKVHP